MPDQQTVPDQQTAPDRQTGRINRAEFLPKPPSNLSRRHSGVTVVAPTARGPITDSDPAPPVSGPANRHPGRAGRASRTGRPARLARRAKEHGQARWTAPSTRSCCSAAVSAPPPRRGSVERSRPGCPMRTAREERANTRSKTPHCHDLDSPDLNSPPSGRNDPEMGPSRTPPARATASLTPPTEPGEPAITPPTMLIIIHSRPDLTNHPGIAGRRKNRPSSTNHN